MSDQKNIQVVGEAFQGALTSVTRELLGGARTLAGQTSGAVHLLLMGKDGHAAAQDGISSGADKVFVADHESMNEYNGDAYAFLITGFCKREQPGLVMMGQTDWGRDLAPRVAARLEAGLCMDCTDVEYDAAQGCFVQTRPVYGGKAMAVMASTAGKMQIDTVRPKSLTPQTPDAGRQGEIVSLPDSFDASSVKARLVQCEDVERGGVDIENAKLIVAGGGGVGGAEGFKMIAELANLLQGSVGATRVPVDEKVVPLSMEIGQTGKMVNPDLYIAIGISGASQHITGCINSKKIVAINKDPEANIFKVSDFGLVADCKVAVPVIIEKLRSLL